MRTLKEFLNFLQEEEEVFSFDELSKYVGRLQRLEYVERTLVELGSGSSRVVFDLGDGRVLKVAINDKGSVQNETEYKLYHKVPKDVKRVLAAISEPHEHNFEWIVAEKAREIKGPEELAKLFGIDAKMAHELFSGDCFRVKKVEDLKSSIQRQVDYFKALDPSKINLARIERYEKALNFTDSFANICLAIPHLESNGLDLAGADQLGILPNGQVVIIDYGFGSDAHGMYNQTPYQQAASLARVYDYGDEEEVDKEYDKYGNVIQRPTQKPIAKPQPPPSPEFSDDDIFF
jgi:hypothetical protein